MPGLVGISDTFNEGFHYSNRKYINPLVPTFHLLLLIAEKEHPYYHQFIIKTKIGNSKKLKLSKILIFCCHFFCDGLGLTFTNKINLYLI